MSVDHLDELIERLNDGDVVAAERAFLAYEPYLRMAVRRQLTGPLRSKLDSMDIVQSVWADVLCRFRESGWRFSDRTHLRAFLMKVARNRLIDRRREHHRDSSRSGRCTRRPLRNCLTPTSRAPARSLKDTSSGSGCWKSVLRPIRTSCGSSGKVCPWPRSRPALACTKAPSDESSTTWPGGLLSPGETRARLPAAHGKRNRPCRRTPSSETTGRTLRSWEREPEDAEPLGGSGSAWVSHQVQAMAAAWARGERISVEEILEQHPDLKTEHAVRLVYEDLCLRREAGEDVSTAEVVSRFPQWREELELLLDCDRLLGPLSRTAILPEVGEQLGPFRLLAELGRGASGKTYLAAEPALADRLVVLKIIPDDQEEHLSLARLQHTHIIPLFSEQAFPDRGLRALCMPYLGGTSLARVLEALAEIPHHHRRGRHLLDVLDKVRRGRLRRHGRRRALSQVP